MSSSSPSSALPATVRMSDAVTITTPAGPARLRRSHRRTLAISVLPNGELELVAPQSATEAAIARKVGKRMRWISQQRAAFADMHRNRIPLRYESGATHTYLGRQYRLKVIKSERASVRLIGPYFHIATRTRAPDEVKRLLDAWFRDRAVEQFKRRLAQWEPWCRHQRLPAPHLHLLRMPKRWGSAGRSGRVALNPDLVRTPSICIDYVIAHEICHLKCPQHDRSFFRALDQVFPNWRAVKERLERFQ